MAPDMTTGDNDESTNGLNVLEDYFEALNSADTLNYSNVNFNSQYYELDNIHESRLTEHFQYKALHWNISSLPNKCEDLKAFLLELSDAGIILDFLMLCETFITDENHHLYNLPGYQIVQRSRTLGSWGGGVALYIGDNLTFKIRNDLTVFYEGEFEAIFVEITAGKKNTIVGEVCRVKTMTKINR